MSSWAFAQSGWQAWLAGWHKNGEMLKKSVFLVPNATFHLAHTRANCSLCSRNGLILNIGSFAAMTSSPMLAPYAGSKAFLYTWSQALGSELEKHRIKVSLVNTYFVVSNLSKIRRSNFMTPTPKVFVRE